MATYRILLRTHLMTDELARTPVGRITPADIEALIVRLRTEGLAPATIRQIHIIVRQVLATAVRDGLIPTNAAAQVRRPASAPGRRPASPLPSCGACWTPPAAHATNR